MKKQNLFSTLLILFAFLTAAAAPLASAQTKNGFAGNWAWKGPMNKKKEHAAFWADIKQKSNKVTGSLWFNMLVDGEADTTDASAIPFIGTIKGDTLMIEFDPADVRAIDENMRYRKPRGKAALAALKLKNGKLEWRQIQGAIGLLGIPKQMTLRRED